MHFAVLGDINANARALRAVLDDIAEQGILTVLQTGNLVLGRGAPGLVLDLLRERRVTFVQGVKDRAVTRFRRKEARLRDRLSSDEAELLSAAHESLSGEAIEALRRLPSRRDLVIEELSILVCHGSVSNASDTLSGGTAEVKFQRQREAAPVDIIVCGGAREPFARYIENTLFVGPGWLDDAPGTACYCVVNTEQAPWTVESRHVIYAAD